MVNDLILSLIPTALFSLVLLVPFCHSLWHGYPRFQTWLLASPSGYAVKLIDMFANTLVDHFDINERDTSIVLEMLFIRI